MGKFNEISQILKQSFDGNDLEVNILHDKVIIDSEKKVVEVNNTLRAANVEINGVPSECFTSAEKEKLNKITTPMQVIGRVDSVELLPTDGVVVGSVYLVGQEGSSDFEEYIVISSNPTTYESLGKMVTAADWEETDETSADYISNKPAVRAGGGTNSIIEGDLAKNIATGDYSHAEGYKTTANGHYAHAEGNGAKATGDYSHAEGYFSKATGDYSHAEGSATTASDDYSHAEGFYSTASGFYSHAEGEWSTASGTGSHAEGQATIASGDKSHAEGQETIANHKSQHVFGEYNIADPSVSTPNVRGNYVEIVGNGTKAANRSNARTLDWAGNEVLAGKITANGINLSDAISTVKLRVSDGTFQVSIDGGTTWHTINFAD